MSNWATVKYDLCLSVYVVKVKIHVNNNPRNLQSEAAAHNVKFKAAVQGR